MSGAPRKPLTLLDRVIIFCCWIADLILQILLCPFGYTKINVHIGHDPIRMKYRWHIEINMWKKEVKTRYYRVF